MNRKACIWVIGAVALVFGIGGFAGGMYRSKSDIHTIAIEPIVIEYSRGYYVKENGNESSYSYEVRNYPAITLAEAFNRIRGCHAEAHDDHFDGNAYISFNKLLFRKLIIYPHGKNPEVEYFDNEQYNDDAKKCRELLIQQLYF